MVKSEGDDVIPIDSHMTSEEERRKIYLSYFNVSNFKFKISKKKKFKFKKNINFPKKLSQTNWFFPKFEGHFQENYRVWGSGTTMLIGCTIKK